MAYEAVFFDWGGVIAGDPGGGFLGRLLADCGASEHEVQEIYSSYMRPFMRGEIPQNKYWETLRQKYSLTIPGSISEKFVEWRGLDVDSDVLLLVDKLRKSGIKTAVLSNMIEPSYNMLDRTGYFERFDQIIASCKVGHDKPDTMIYQLALQRLDVEPENSIFIDDVQAFLDPAIEMGFATILASSPQQIINDISKLIPLKV